MAVSPASSPRPWRGIGGRTGRSRGRCTKTRTPCLGFPYLQPHHFLPPCDRTNSAGRPKWKRRHDASPELRVFLLRGPTQLGRRKKILASAGSRSEIDARLGCRPGRGKDRAATAAEIKPTEPGRASPAKGVRDYPEDYCFDVSPENRRHRRRCNGAQHCMASCSVRLPGHRL
jgi:hypothetical protein